MNRTLDIATSVAATLSRLGTGASVGPLGSRPQKPLEVYDFEGCPYCRKVREALTILDLDAKILPCPKGGPRFREELKTRGGRYQFPYLVDPNTGKALYESNEIVQYLFQEYGDGRVPATLAAGPFTDLSSFLAGVWRPGFGVYYRPARAPEQPLELWSYEASPFCRMARETLSCLELPYLLHNVAKGSPDRPAYIERSGRMLVPYLVDPNTGAAMHESAEIVAYLEATYLEG